MSMQDSGRYMHMDDAEGYTLLGMAQVAKWSDDVLRTLAELGVPETRLPREVFVCTLIKSAGDVFSVFDLSGSEISIACSPTNIVKEVAESIRLLKEMECDGEVYILLADGSKAIPEQLLRDVATPVHDGHFSEPLSSTTCCSLFSSPKMP